MAAPKGITKELNIDEVIDLIIDGLTFRAIATKYGCAVSLIHSFLSKDEHSARVRAALELSASQYANKAEEVLISAESNKNEIQRARELAQHYRWMASKRAPKKYGDKLDVTSDGKEMKGVTVVVQNKDQADTLDNIG